MWRIGVGYKNKIRFGDPTEIRGEGLSLGRNKGK